MSVGNELSGEVAVTLLEMKGAVNPHDLEDVLAMFCSTLRELSIEGRERRRARLTIERPPGMARGANQGVN